MDNKVRAIMMAARKIMSLKSSSMVHNTRI